MKKFLLVLGLILFVFNTHAQVNEYTQYLIEYYNVDYEMTIKKYVTEEYGTNHPMITVEINDQSKSLFTIADIFKYENKEILSDAIIEFSREGYERKNKEIFENLKQITLPDLIKLHCNWSDVLYEYNNQVEAKDSF